METVGTSPKAIAAAITAYLAPIVAGYLANRWGVDVKADTATTFIGPVVFAAVVFVAARLAKPGTVVDTNPVGPASDELLAAPKLAEVDAEPATPKQVKDAAEKISKPAARTAAKRKKAS